jgi:L-threonylcarbamoyladenylate synthase
VKKNYLWEKVPDRLLLAQWLQKGEIVISETDTICGLLANITENSIEKLHRIKKDRGEKPYLILINSIRKLDDFVDTNTLTSQMLNVVKNCWPGPLTIIFKAKATVPDFLTSKKRTIALRCPKHEGIQELTRNFDGLFSTSANKSGEKAPQRISEIDEDILEMVSFVISNKNDLTVRKILPSSIIDFSYINFSSCDKEKNKLRIIREGAYSRQELEKYYE